MQAFTFVWMGQLVSLLGSAMSLFAFTIWAWERTNHAITLAMISFWAYVPTLLFSPVAGALVDRWNRKLVMLLSDLGTALATLSVLVLYLTDRLQPWHLFAAGCFGGLFLAFQFPAYSATTILMIPREQYARAEGMLGLAQAASTTLGPILAAALIGRIGIAGILVIDLVTFLAAFGTLLWVRIPRPPAPAEKQAKGLLAESFYGFRYIFERPALRALVLLFLGGNLFEGLGTTLINPMILARSANNEISLGSVQSIGALGGILGGVLISTWGGPKRRIHGIVIGWSLACGLGLMLMGAGGTLGIWSAASFCFAFCVAIVNSSEQAIWQTKTAPAVQGKVAATRLLLIQAPFLVAMPLAGWLADNVFEPGIQTGGALARFQGLVGTGPGAGMGLLIFLAGLGGMLIILGGYTFRSIRCIEDRLPDYDGQPAPETGMGK
jgi:MFS transporter, DHA3 family, macrolide efflux protein